MNLGVMYLGVSMNASIVETVLHGKAVQSAISLDDLVSRGMAVMTFEDDLTFVNYNGVGLSRNLTTSEVFTCQHTESRAWSAEIMANGNQDGIYYPCRHNNQEYSAVLFDGRTIVSQISSMGRLDEIDKVFEILDDHHVAVM